MDVSPKDIITPENYYHHTQVRSLMLIPSRMKQIIFGCVQQFVLTLSSDDSVLSVTHYNKDLGSAASIASWRNY